MAASPNRVLLITSIFPPQVGGPAIFAYRYSNWLSENRIPNVVISYGDQVSPDFKGVVRLIPIGKSRIRSFIAMVWEILKNFDCNTVVIANGCFVEISIAAAILRRPFIAKIPGDPVWERARNQGKTKLSIEDFQIANQSLRLKMLRRLFNFSFRRAAHVVAPSAQLANFLSLWGVVQNRIHVIYNSVDPRIFLPNEKSQKLYDLVCVCRLVKWKGLEEVIETAARLNLRLAIIGDGPLKGKLAKIALRSNCEVTFLGNLGNSEVVSKLNESKIYVLNSQFEATSYSLIEAKMCALPIVARASSGTKLVITHGVDGLLCDIDHEDCLQNSISELLGNSDLQRVLGESARIDALTRFNQSINFEKILLLTGIN
jgi:glycosyltransferase involved in cell wall biosynthesis